MTKAAFRAFLLDPQTGPRLDALLADNARVDAQLRQEASMTRSALNDRDRRDADAQDGPATSCSDCGRDCIGHLCDECCEERDAWAAKYAIRMAKAALPADARKTA